ncbi:DUF829 domain protein (PaxU) [Cordyceps javanica]|nr:DUF829 domain protein (PaxU) [Cordyceps javanica]
MEADCIRTRPVPCQSGLHPQQPLWYSYGCYPSGKPRLPLLSCCVLLICAILAEKLDFLELITWFTSARFWHGTYSSRQDGTLSSDGQFKSRAGSSEPAADGTPETVLFLSWADADSRVIEKYTKLYNELYPGSNIILVESDMAAFFMRPVRTRRKLVEPVVRMLRDTPDDSLHVHVMSNAGSQQWCTINKAYLEQEGRTLSNSPTVIDSAPGRSHSKNLWASFSRSLPAAAVPRMALRFVFGIAVCLITVARRVRPGSDPLEATRRQLNEHAPTVVGSRRCYFYSDKDALVGWEDVEAHAKDAERKGWRVEPVKFEGSPHVGHLKQNPEKYRKAIERTRLVRSKL